MILRPYLDARPAVAASYLFGRGGRLMGSRVDATEAADRDRRESQALWIPIRPVVATHRARTASRAVDASPEPPAPGTSSSPGTRPDITAARPAR